MRIVYTWLVLATALAGQDPGAKGVNFFSIAAEREEGRKACDVPAVVDEALQRRADGILTELATKVDPAWPFEIRVYDDSVARAVPAGLFLPLDAFSGKATEPVSCAGGPILLPRGMAAASDTELREHIAHAMAHIALRHASRLATRVRMMQMVIRLPDTTTQQAATAMELANRRSLELTVRGFEQQASRWAVELIAKLPRV